jgi:diguanylate cyclase (GGDEF)-like protein
VTADSFRETAAASGVGRGRRPDPARASPGPHRASFAEAQLLAPLGSWEWDLATNRVTWSEEMYRIHRVDPETYEPSFDAYMDLVHPDDREQVAAEAEAALWEKRSSSNHYRLLHPDGTVQEIHGRGEVILGEGGVPVKVVGTCQDVMERRRAEAVAVLRAAQQAKVAELGQQALAGAQVSDLMQTATAALREVLGVEITIVLEMDSAEGHFLAREGTGLPLGVVDRAMIPGSRDWQPGFTVDSGSPSVVEDWAVEERFARPRFLADLGAMSGAMVPIEARGESFGVLGVAALERRSFSSEDVHFLQAVANVLANATERRTTEERIRHRALHDPLTDLPNRRLFLDRLGQALARSERKDVSVAVLFLDLDQFKLVNDSLGHEAGDNLLKAVAPRLQDTMRSGDTVSRFGGDEFGVLLEELSSELDATHAAERIAAALARPFIVGEREHFVTASVGIAIGGKGDMPEGLIRDADAAMYRAKDRGRGRYEIFDGAMRARAVEHLRIENDLRRAVERDELRLHYQPVVSLQDGSIRAVEALLRWEHPERGLIGPAEFLSIAEEGGLIVPVGRWVLERACRQAAAWHAARPDSAPIGISVNLSARQLTDPGLRDEVANLLAGTGIEPMSLSLEATERALIEETAELEETMRELKALGCRLLLDDFGTGFSSLGHLKRFPLDGVKVDRSFIERLGAERADIAIIRAIVQIADDLDLSVIAEGVETESQLQQVVALGCGYAQGHYFARPLPAGEMGELLEARPAWLRRGASTGAA